MSSRPPTRSPLAGRRSRPPTVRVDAGVERGLAAVSVDLGERRDGFVTVELTLTHALGTTTTTVPAEATGIEIDCRTLPAAGPSSAPRRSARTAGGGAPAPPRSRSLPARRPPGRPSCSRPATAACGSRGGTPPSGRGSATPDGNLAPPTRLEGWGLSVSRCGKVRVSLITGGFPARHPASGSRPAGAAASIFPPKWLSIPSLEAVVESRDSGCGRAPFISPDAVPEVFEERRVPAGEPGRADKERVLVVCPLAGSIPGRRLPGSTE